MIYRFLPLRCCAFRLALVAALGLLALAPPDRVPTLFSLPQLAAQVAPKPQEPPAPGVPPLPGQAAKPETLQSLLDRADAIFQQMSEITGLPIKAPLQRKIIDRAQMKEFLTTTLHRENSPHDIHVQEAALKAFGIVSSDFDLSKFLVTLYTEQAAGVYDLYTKTMYIASWVEPDMQETVLAHELTHALEDQSFDLKKLLHGARDSDDATSARQALSEGHATAAMMQHMLGSMSLAEVPSVAPLMDQALHQMKDYPVFTSAPFFFRYQALFPYSQGAGFVQAGIKRGGWQELVRVFQNPPSTTREIFDPPAYYDHEPQDRVKLPHPPALSGAKDLSFLAENAMGELGYYALLGQLISEEEAKKVVPSWRADHYLVYENSRTHRYTLISRTRWGNSESALAFFRSYLTILKTKYPGLTPDQHSGEDLFLASAANGQIVVMRRGADCVWAEGVPPAKSDSVRQWLEALAAPRAIADEKETIPDAGAHAPIRAGKPSTSPAGPVPASAAGSR